MSDGQNPTLTYVSRTDVANSVLRMLSLCRVCATRHVARFYEHTTRPSIRAWEVLHYLHERDYIESYRAGMNKEAIYRLSKRIRKQYGIIPVRWNSSVMEHRLAVTEIYLDLGEPETFIVEYRSEYEWRGRRHVLSPDVYTEVQLPKGVALTDTLDSNGGLCSTQTLGNVQTSGHLLNSNEGTNSIPTLGNVRTSAHSQIIATSQDSNSATSHYLQPIFIEVQRTPIESKRWAEKRTQYETYFASGMWQQEFETKPVVVIVMSEPQMSETIGSSIGYEIFVVRNISEVIEQWGS